MVTAKTQYSLANAQSYFAEHLAIGDYYQEGQKVAGEWFGIGAESLGLSGKVGETVFLALCGNEHPRTGDCLTQRKNGLRKEDGETKANRRIFYDFTFSPPKSVSIAAVVAGDERIVESRERAVRVALTEFEQFAATRVRKRMADGSRLTKNLVAALFTHDTSRALDPTCTSLLRSGSRSRDNAHHSRRPAPDFVLPQTPCLPRHVEAGSASDSTRASPLSCPDGDLKC